MLPATRSAPRHRATHDHEAFMELLFAYIDPGSGSLLIQALIAGLVAIPIFFRHQIGRAINAVRHATGNQRSEAAPGKDDAARGA
jgi:hypothetical protein